MDSRIKIHSNWLSDLAEAFPESVDQLGALAEHMFAKQEKLATLIRFCAARPELPMMRMYAEYSAALDAVALEPAREVETEVSDEEAKLLGSRQRAARTKRLRSRAWIVKTVATLIAENAGEWRLDEVPALSGMSNATLHNHFRSRSQLAAAAYDHLIANG